VSALVDQPVRLLVVEGVVQAGELRRAGLTEADLLGVLRQRGVHRMADVRFLVYEDKGAFSLLGWDQPVDVQPALSALTASGQVPAPPRDPA
jgi:uncharacterized membrane protein YcaP (DUF421 family)